VDTGLNTAPSGRRPPIEIVTSSTIYDWPGEGNDMFDAAPYAALETYYGMGSGKAVFVDGEYTLKGGCLVLAMVLARSTILYARSKSLPPLLPLSPPLTPFSPPSPPLRSHPLPPPHLLLLLPPSPLFRRLRRPELMYCIVRRWGVAWLAAAWDSWLAVLVADRWAKEERELDMQQAQELELEELALTHEQELEEEEEEEKERQRLIKEEGEGEVAAKRGGGEANIRGGCAVHCYGVMVAEGVWRGCDGLGARCRPLRCVTSGEANLVGARSRVHTHKSGQRRGSQGQRTLGRGRESGSGRTDGGRESALRPLRYHRVRRGGGIS
jgi:hypothetical protein